jgi:type VI secretion system secreted protein VgrG
VEGVQTAIIVGPDGEEIYTDEFGRVKVHFHWDRLGHRDDQSSCWIRVSQSWAGAGWGAIHIPRIGQEVIVDFIEGDPDRPIVTGRVYHGTNRPPYALPDNKTQSGIKSDTSPGGGGSNELRFEDKAGAEEVFLHAQKDMTTAVNNNQSTSVGANQTVTVKANQNITVEKERWDEVKEYHSLHVGGNQQINVDGDGGAGFAAVGPYTVSSEKKVEVFVSDTTISEDDSSITLSAPTTITLVVGSSSIELTKDGVAISAKKITLAGTEEVKLSVGSSSVTVDAKGVSTGGPKISSAAVGMHEISGALIKIN